MKKIRYLIIPSLILVAFIIWTILVKTVDVRYINGIGFLGFYQLNTDINFKIQLMDTKLFHVLSNILLYASMLTVLPFAILGVVELIKRKSLAKVDRILYILLGSYAAIVIFYFVFELVKINFSPLSTPEDLKPSYPSSHIFIFISLVGAGLIGFNHYKQNKTLFIASFIEFGLLIVLMAILRMFSGHHYFTDVIGGILLGLFISSASYSVSAYLGELKKE